MSTKRNIKVIYVEVYPYEHDAYKAWMQGKFHTISDAIRSHMRKVTGLDPQKQEKNNSNTQSACTG